MSLSTVIRLAALIEILEGKVDLRTKRMWSQSHSRILCDALPQLSVHPHQLLSRMVQCTPWALLNSLFLICLEILSPTAVELLTSTNLPSSTANPLREFSVPIRDGTGSTHAICLKNGLVKYLLSTPKLSNKPSTVKGVFAVGERG